MRQDAFRIAVEAERQGRVEDAERIYRELAPHHWKVRANLSLLLLSLGKLEEGFALYEDNLQHAGWRADKPALSFPEWKGEEVSSLLVWPEQGFGDQIFNARWVRELSQKTRVTVLSPPPLERLFRTLPVEVIRQEGAVSIPRHDAWAMMGSLAHRCGTVPTEPYFPSGQGEGIGVCAKGNPKFFNDAARSLPPEAAERLNRLGRSLLPEDTGARDFLETAQIIAGLELVISVDTAVANLACAMGKPCWVLLPTPSDWRWMRGDRTPWYPSARLYRNRGDWGEVLDRIELAVRSRSE